jgi:hypothetical protein
MALFMSCCLKMGDTPTKLTEQLFSDYAPKDIHALAPECKTALTKALREAEPPAHWPVVACIALLAEDTS